MIKAIIFDIDNTMYSFDRAHEAAMAALGAYVKENFDMEPADMADLIKKCADIVTERTGDNCAALHNRLLRFQCFLEEIGSTEYQKAMEMYHVYWDTILEVMEPEPGLVPLLSRLRARGIRLGIGSDMTAYIQYKKLEKLGVLKYLDFIVTSEEAGEEKPTPRFFELCVKKAGCKPEECIFIGDSLKKDVIGSTEFGMKGTWYHPSQDDTSAERSECASRSVPCRETWYHPSQDDTSAERSECASRSVPCRETWYHPERDDTGYPVIRSFEDFMRGEEQERDG